MSSDLEIKALDGKIFIKFTGNVNLYNLNSIKEDLVSILESSNVIEIDFSSVQEFDSAACQFFISLQKYCDSKKIKLKLTGHSNTIISIFDTYGLIGFFRDKVHVSSDDKDNYKFSYGMKKFPKALR
ncbi:MAG: STAS domain-containing protein [Leptospiraceae bacterium]|nr:STAS domain-containing protein [Leptospiraceae bacterium]